MKYGLILSAPTIEEQMSCAVRAEDAGFESVWTTEFFNAHGFVRLAAVATATKRVKLGTGIAYAFMRTPMLAASAAMDIDELSGGRMVLGLGSGTERMNREWYSMPFEDPPAPRIKDAIALPGGIQLDLGPAREVAGGFKPESRYVLEDYRFRR